MPGLGHEETSMIRCFNKITWAALLKNLRRMLNFMSPVAQLTLCNVHEHHKSWATLKTVFVGTRDGFQMRDMVFVQMKNPILQAFACGAALSQTLFYDYGTYLHLCLSAISFPHWYTLK